MQVKMLETRRGSPDGFTVARYHAAGIYEIPDSLAASFINKGQAVAVNPKSLEQAAAELMADLAAKRRQV